MWHTSGGPLQRDDEDSSEFCCCPRFNVTSCKDFLIFLKLIWTGESVVQSKSTRSQKPKLSAVEHGHPLDGWPLGARLCILLRFLQSNSVQTLQKSFGWYYKPRSPVCIHMHTLKILCSPCQSSMDYGNAKITSMPWKFQVFGMLDTIPKKKRTNA